MLHKNCNASNNQNELCDMFELTKRFVIDAKFKVFHICSISTLFKNWNAITCILYILFVSFDILSA